MARKQRAKNPDSIIGQAEMSDGAPRRVTVLLRGGHKWDCNLDGAESTCTALLQALHRHEDRPGTVLQLQSPRGELLLVPESEIVGVVADAATSRSVDIKSLLLSLARHPTVVPNHALPGSPFVVVENFLNEDEHRRALSFALANQDKYASSTVVNAAGGYGGSENFRRSLVLYDIAEILPMFLPKIEALYPTVWSRLGMSPFAVKQIECQLTAHGDGDYFKRHNDNGSPETLSRGVSYVYYFHGEPKPFSGGQLRMYETVEQDGFYTCGSQSLDVEPRDNSLIVFPSHCHHEVLPVKCATNSFADRRFTLNGWLVRA